MFIKFINKNFKFIMITCFIVTTVSVGILMYLVKPNPPPYTIAKTQDDSKPGLIRGTLYIYTESTTEKHLYDTAKSLSNAYKDYGSLRILFFREGDSIDYGPTVGIATVVNRKISNVTLYSKEIQMELRSNQSKY